MSGPAFLSETRERFLKAILAQLPVDRVRELYLFQPMKQGGVESGVAVVAGYSEEAAGDTATRAAEAAAAEAHVTAAAESVAGEGPVAETDAAEAGAVQPVGELPTVDLDDVTGDAADALACGVPAVDASSDEAAAADDETAAADDEAAASDDETVAADDETAAADEEAAASDDETAAVEGGAIAAQATPAEKYTVYTARYRHVLKGPDRGKWEASLVAEAEAPLLSIETVVRGVQRRSGDVDAPDHMTAADIRAALRLTNPSTSDAA